MSGPTLQDFTQAICPLHKPNKCPPFGTCCTFSQYCSTKTEACESCFPPAMADNQRLEWCHTDGLHNVSAWPHPTCKYACQELFNNTALYGIEENSMTGMTTLELVLTVTTVLGAFLLLCIVFGVACFLYNKFRPSRKNGSMPPADEESESDKLMTEEDEQTPSTKDISTSTASDNAGDDDGEGVPATNPCDPAMVGVNSRSSVDSGVSTSPSGLSQSPNTPNDHSVIEMEPLTNQSGNENTNRPSSESERLSEGQGTGPDQRDSGCAQNQDTRSSTESREYASNQTHETGVPHQGHHPCFSSPVVSNTQPEEKPELVTNQTRHTTAKQGLE